MYSIYNYQTTKLSRESTRRTLNEEDALIVAISALP